MSNDIATAITHTPIALSAITKAKPKAAKSSAKPTQSAAPKYQIERNIPIPAIHQPLDFPFGQMAHGDSIFIPLGKGETEAKTRNRVQSAFRRWKKLTRATANIKQTTRACTKDGAPGIRFWILVE